MTEKIDRELAEILRAVTRATPFTNAAAIHRVMNLPLPGRVGDCAFLCNELIAAAAHIPGEAHLHRAVSENGLGGRKGEPGSHVLVLKKTKNGSRILDPTLLHERPFSLEVDTEEGPYIELINTHLPSRIGGTAYAKFELWRDRLEVSTPFVAQGSGSSGIYTFNTSAADRVHANGLENATKAFVDYFIRFVFEEGTAQLIYRERSNKMLWVQEGLAQESTGFSLDGASSQTVRKDLDQRLGEFGFDLSLAVNLLRRAPELQRQYRAECD